jgi:hypothetical protein
LHYHQASQEKGQYCEQDRREVAHHFSGLRTAGAPDKERDQQKANWDEENNDVLEPTDFAGNEIEFSSF